MESLRFPNVVCSTSAFHSRAISIHVLSTICLKCMRESGVWRIKRSEGKTTKISCQMDETEAEIRMVTTALLPPHRPSYNSRHCLLILFFLHTFPSNKSFSILCSNLLLLPNILAPMVRHFRPPVGMAFLPFLSVYIVQNQLDSDSTDCLLSTAGGVAIV